MYFKTVRQNTVNFTPQLLLPIPFNCRLKLGISASEQRESQQSTTFIHFSRLYFIRPARAPRARPRPFFMFAFCVLYIVSVYDRRDDGRPPYGSCLGRVMSGHNNFSSTFAALTFKRNSAEPDGTVQSFMHGAQLRWTSIS